MRVGFEALSNATKETEVNLPQKTLRRSLIAAAAMVALLNAGCESMERMGQKIGLGGKTTTANLAGSHEVPPVSTKASGKSTITVADDQTVSGSVIIDDMTANAAHIHQGAPGANGPVIIPLTKSGDKTFVVPAKAKLTDSQYAAYKDGNLYVNVHSPTHPNGEVRVQLKP
jgi:hypothetical protein